MGASGVLVDVLCDWQVQWRAVLAEALAGTLQPFSCGVPPALHLAALPVQVLVQVSFEEGQKSIVSAEYSFK